ncbi:MAG TPA: phosphotransferase [Ktedonobacterales bacterium]|nr:phosphotransferase [Ktedonobacterales bacterium]
MQEGWERLHAQLPLDMATLATLLAPALPGHALLHAEPLTGGLANTNYTVTLAGLDTPVVVRVYTREPEACARERALYTLVRERVLVPDCLYTGTTPDGRPYMVSRWIEGAKLDALLPTLTGDALEAVSRAVGATLARIGEYRFPRWGFFGPDLAIATPVGDSRQVTVGYIEEALFSAPATARLEPALQGRVWTLVRENAALLDAIPDDARLVHSDYKAQNLLVRPTTTGGWEVAALDWEFALAATPLIDLGILLRYAERLDPAFERGVIAGYLATGGQLPADWKRMTKLLDLMNLCGFLARPEPQERMIADVTRLLVATVAGWGSYGRERYGY